VRGRERKNHDRAKPTACARTRDGLTGLNYISLRFFRGDIFYKRTMRVRARATERERERERERESHPYFIGYIHFVAWYRKPINRRMMEHG